MYPASAKQVAFIQKLSSERAHVVVIPQTSKEASALITALLAMPRVQTGGTVGAGVTEPGMYRDAEGGMFKVQSSKEDATRLYAKALVRIGGERLTETDDVVGWEFVYAPGAVRALRADQRLTLEEARAFGIRYGVCCVCGRFLKDATSVAQGIGPVCAGRL